MNEQDETINEINNMSGGMIPEISKRIGWD